MSHSVSASSFRSLLHCPHSLFLDHHGDPTLKTDLGEFEQYLLDEGKRFEQEFISGKNYVQPIYPEGDLDAGFDATLELMHDGVTLIYRGVLKADRTSNASDAEATDSQAWTSTVKTPRTIGVADNQS